MVKVPALLLCACVVLSGCTTTVRNRSGIATTNASPVGLGTSTNASSPHPTNYYAPPRLALQSVKETNRTPTVEAVPVSRQKERYNGIPRLAGTVVQNKPQNGSREAVVKKTGAAEESDGQTASALAGQSPEQPVGSVSATFAQAADDPSQDSDVPIFKDPNFLRAFGLLVVLAVGVWGVVRFFDSEKSLNPSSLSNGNGSHSDDSQKSSPEKSFFKTFRVTTDSPPKQRWFETTKKYSRRVTPEKEPTVEDTTVTNPKQVIFKEDEKYRIAHEADVAIREQQAKAADSGSKQNFEKYRERIAKEANGLIIEGLNGSSQRFFENGEADKVQKSPEAKDIKANGQG